MSLDSTKLLTEKLALSRDLAAITPEVEHLRSQVASHQTLLADKLLLQRQLSTAQVELETEKRATHRALAKEGGRKAQDAQLESQIEELQAEVIKERRSRQKAEREVQQTSVEFENKQASLKSKAERELQQAVQEADNAQTVLSSRLDAFRAKLRATKEQLKDTQEELRDVRLRAKSDTRATDVGQENSTAVLLRKRNIAHVDDVNIGTPDGLPHAKRVRQGSALPGDKSTFSITPFLNRTTSVAPESPPANAVGQTAKSTLNAIGETADAEIPSEMSKCNPTAKATLSRRKGGVVSANQLTKSIKVSAPMEKVRRNGRLEQVQEEAEDELPVLPVAQSIVNQVIVSDEKEKLRHCDNVDDTTILKKKRKLLGSGGLGRTLFDEGDGEEDALGQRGPFALRKPIHSGAKKGLQPKKRETSVGGFGAISPLKKDKRLGR